MEFLTKVYSTLVSAITLKIQLGDTIGKYIAEFEKSSGLVVKKIKLEREGGALKVKVKAEL
jgi:hypothetical protein